MNYSYKEIKENIVRFLKNNILFLTFVITSIINSSLLRFLTVKNYFELPPIFGDLAVILFISAIGYLLKPKNQFWYFLGFSIFTSVLCVVNCIYYTNYLSFVSLSLLATSSQVAEVSDAVSENIFEWKDLCFLWQIVAIIFANYAVKKKKGYPEREFKVRKKYFLNILISGFILIGILTSMLTTTDISRLDKQWNRESVVMRFGIYIYHVNDMIASIRPQIVPLFGYDSNVVEFKNYYLNRASAEASLNKTNEYTNIFLGKNIITIHAESMQEWLMEASFNGLPVTPNLNWLASEGLFFSNFYAQESVGTSSDSEFTLNTSLMPSSSGTVFMNYYNREYVTIPKLLKEKGYYTFSMHGNKGAMWNRNVVHKNFGYDNFFYHTKDFVIDEVLGLGLTDKSFFRQAVPKIKDISNNNTNFYGTMIMLTNHTPFSDVPKISDYDVDFKYEKFNEETNQNEIVSAPFLEGRKLGNYVKSAHYADEAIGEFIHELDEAGILENTVIVIYGDHDAKVKDKEYSYYYNYDPYTDTVLSKDDPNYVDVDYYSYELNRKVPLIIWSKDNKVKGEVTKVMGMYDVMPTLGNMFGFENKYALGHDIFSIDENVVIFPNGNWLTDKIYYNSQKDEWRLLDPNYPISMEYIEKYKKQATDINTVSNAIITYDLIKRTKETQILEDYIG